MHTRDQSDIDCAPSGGLGALPQGHGSQPRGLPEEALEDLNAAISLNVAPRCVRRSFDEGSIDTSNGKIPIHFIEFEEFRLASGTSILLGPLLI